MQNSLYDRLGGENALLAAVHRFYMKVLSDQDLAPFFAGLDIEKQTNKMVSFMTWAFDGPAEHRGRSLGAAHAHLVKNEGLAASHFDRVADLLSDTLSELGVDAETSAEVLGVVGTTRDAVLSGDPGQ
ncbi:MAG: group 1 truncated hemoglobin [Pseudomonadota bacterium]